MAKQRPDMKSQAEEIHAVTGMYPDDRWHIPVSEQRLLIEDVQAGNSRAAEIIMSQRLRWIYETMQDPEFKGNPNLTPADIMHLGMVAAFEALKKVRVDAPKVNSALQNATAREFMRLLDSEMPVTEEVKLALFADDRTILPQSPEREAYKNEFSDLLEEAFSMLSPRERSIFELRYGFNGEAPHTLAEVGLMFNLTGGAISRIEQRAHRKIRRFFYTRKIGGAHNDIDTEDLVNSGLRDESRYIRPYMPRDLSLRGTRRKDAEPEETKKDNLSAEADSRWTPEQLVKQLAWLKEIDDKQERGEIAFVTGNLRKKPLPIDVQTFLASRISNNPGGRLKEIVRHHEESIADPAYRQKSDAIAAAHKANKSRDKLDRAKSTLAETEREYALAVEAAGKLVQEAFGSRE